MKIKILITLIIILSAILYATQIFYTTNKSNLKDISNILVGNDKDIHGCIRSAGYSWCEAKNKCFRPWEEKCEVSITTTSTISLNIQNCTKRDGVWYPEEGLCEANQLNKSQCEAYGGKFNECASACRHDPKAEVCTMQCVLTCTFK